MATATRCHVASFVNASSGGYSRDGWHGGTLRKPLINKSASGRASGAERFVKTETTGIWEDAAAAAKINRVTRLDRGLCGPRRACGGPGEGLRRAATSPRRNANAPDERRRLVGDVPRRNRDGTDLRRRRRRRRRKHRGGSGYELQQQQQRRPVYTRFHPSKTLYNGEDFAAIDSASSASIRGPRIDGG
ncbi:unnamed protein product [Lampetra planeri]